MDPDICWDNVDVLAHSDAEPEVKANLGSRIERVTFGEKIYIPKRSYMKYIKPWHVIIGAAIVILIVLIIITASLAKTNVDTGQSDLLNHFQNGLLIRDNNSIFGYDPKIKKMSLIHKAEKSINAFNLYMDKTIFWNDNSSIVSSSIGEWTTKVQNLSIVFKESRFNPHAIAIDTFTEKLYVIDKTAGTLVVIDIKSRNYGIILADLLNPHDIVLDPAQGVLFILELGRSILKGNMDGSNLNKLNDRENIVAITIDCKAEKLYWVRDFNKIERSEYNGYPRESLFTDHVNIISLSIFDDRLFWLWPASESSNATLWSCKIHNDTSCKNHRMEPINLHNATLIKTYPSRNKIASENPCTLRNGGCEQMCLLASGTNAGRSCGCYAGLQLNTDPRTCQNISDFMLYTAGNFVRGRILDPSRVPFSEVFLPTRFYTQSLIYKNLIDFEYVAHNHDFYFSDDVHIYKLNLKGAGNQTIVQNCPDSHYIEDLAFDWLSGNMYYSKRTKSPEDLHAIMMFNINHPLDFTRTVTSYIYRTGFGLNACPYALAVYPKHGFLFYSAGDGSKRSIYRTTLNGTRLTMSSSNIEFVHEYRLLTLDYEKDRVYWIHSSSFETDIRFADLDGSNEDHLRVRNVRDSRTLYVDHQWMYLSTGTSIWRIHKEQIGTAIRVAPRLGTDIYSPIAGVKIINSTIYSTTDNPCAVNNGDCEQFCYSSPTKTCDCMDGQNPQTDGQCL